jgi:radical SAM superfamily enzyme YgiQ (UPF0313 family)
MKVVLVSTYDLGRQPFGLASPAAWLRAGGHEVTQVDLAVGTLPVSSVREADLVGFYLPMHTATRLAADIIPKIRILNRSAHLCCYGLYAGLNADYLRSLGVESIIGAEFEQALRSLADGGRAVRISPLDRLSFMTPDRSGLPVLSRYPKLVMPDGQKRRSGSTEASRGCKHRCRHCPVVPVYDGSFRVVQPQVVLEDIRRQVAAGAEHVNFGDPDFFNGPAHARRIVEALHAEFQGLSYDVTIKIQHLIEQRGLLPLLQKTNCLFITTAVESLDDRVLQRLDKGHTRADFILAVELCKGAGLTLAPTFIPFTPWTTAESYRDLLRTLAALDLTANVAPVQLALRLLIPSGSRLLELDDIHTVITGYDERALVYRWRHPDPGVDELGKEALRVVDEGTRARLSRQEIFTRLQAVAGVDHPVAPARCTIPYLEEPWFC